MTWPSQLMDEIELPAPPANRPEPVPEHEAAVPLGAKLYDLLFGLPLMLWYALGFAARAPIVVRELATVLLPHPDPLVLLDAMAKAASLLFAALLIGLVAIRRPASTGAKGLIAKSVAFLGAFLGAAILLLPHHAIAWPVQLVSIALALAGMGFAVYALFWLGRSYSVMSEARTLVTGGPYGIVRHPLYLGEETALIGLTLQFLSPAAVAILLLQIAFQLCRMQFEEQVMRRAFAEYADYERRIKRLIPFLY